MTQSSDVSTIGVPVEFKFIGDAEPGVFTGYGSVFDLVDHHGDSVARGAFAASLAEHKSRATSPAMFVEHSAFLGGDPLPVGKWLAIAEDDKGLRVKGKISALDTDHGRRVRGLMADGALSGLSIAYRTRSFVAGKRDGEPKRTLTKVDLHSIDVVRDPSNPAALIDGMRSILMNAGHPAVQAIAAAVVLHHSTMSGSDSPTADERAALLAHLQAAHTALTGQPCGMKSALADELTRPDIEELLHTAGLPRAATKKLLAGGWPLLTGAAVETRQAPTPGYAEIRAKLAATIAEAKSSNRS